jgi:hypothetical protein
MPTAGLSRDEGLQLTELPDEGSEPAPEMEAHEGTFLAPTWWI